MIRSLFFLLALSFSFAQAKLLVVVSVPPQAWIAKEIGGDLVEVVTIAPSVVSSSAYEPKQSQIAALAKASVYMSCGAEFEKNWLDRFAAAAPQMKFYAADGGFTKLKTITGTDDTRIWYSALAMRTMAQATMRALSESDPSNMGKYQINGMKLFQKIDRIKSNIMSQLAAYHNKAFLAYPAAFSYIANDYRLRQIAINFKGEPRPSDIAQLKSAIQSEGVTTMLVEDESYAKSANALAKELGVHVETIALPDDDWEAMMNAVTVYLVNAFN
ncbi:MAG: zinc ABC transporter substrate-binding protein [Helicobacteraceae bacterium]|jgi:zinc transport system substrate-binding protein|nr:zinc ABC transporter substrate-binding protein [Helicobacteraceae bacterium]